MTSALLGPVKDVGRRLRVVGLVPTGTFVAAVLALVAAGAPVDPPSWDRLATRVRDLTAVQGIALLLAVVLVVVLVLPAQVGLIRLLEGYWGSTPPAVKLAKWRRKRHGDRRDQLERDTHAPAGEPLDVERRRAMARAASALRARYPRAADVLPTTLGNALRAAENRAGGRYGLDTVTVWPRLYAVLPERSARLVDDLREQLDLAANMCVAMLALAVSSAVLLLPHGLWLLVPIGALVVAWLAYRGACTAAIAHGEGLDMAFDLYRFDLLRTLHLPLPDTWEHERAANAELTAFFLQGGQFPLPYNIPEPPPPAVPTPAPPRDDEAPPDD